MSEEARQVQSAPTSPFENGSTTPLSPVPAVDPRRVTFDRATRSHSGSNIFLNTTDPPPVPGVPRRRSSIDPKKRPTADAYHDSRAATRAEFRRRATTLQEYYRQHPEFLPQLPFTFRHGFKRWKLGALIFLIVLDACIIPIILYYSLTFGGNVQGWITFAVITAIWGGPTYLEFAIRSWRLILKERFFRPLGASSRWSFDITNWIFVVTITCTTALLIVGAAPHEVFLRVLSMPGPALLLCLGGCLMAITIYHLAGLKAPFRLSSTAKGDPVNPGVYYIVEDIVAVNAGGGLPFREGLAARYEASPVFRKMMRDQSLFWSIGAILVGIACTVVVCVHTVSHPVAYGIGWGVPFVWAGIWTCFTVVWVRRTMHLETATWESTAKQQIANGINGAADSTTTNGLGPSETEIPMAERSTHEDTNTNTNTSSEIEDAKSRPTEVPPGTV